MMEQVVRQDQELAVRIRQLREEDVVLVRQARQVNAKVCTLAADADALASHNPIAKKEVTEFADDDDVGVLAQGALEGGGE